ncbi:hypothetical protein M4951_17970 [Blastopirellula sp. J2-11]|uniref:hypothetical protein n=1 Tax=Blastopirellula sp. J2-11 TaxID=2943192 RepID=UPI0021C57946|nr:hypothetical protein [Blastopirellula sp. J2-11]UUO05256.1 hypothetical protein M4951_17970 [Blastopirellula sp. J2-11]
MNRKQPPRRGAILLVVLSVLVLFALVGVTFVVTAAQFKRAADAGRANPTTSDMPQQDADSVMLDLVRGPKVGTSSALIGGDLLRDLYGRESRHGTINTVISGDGALTNGAGDIVPKEFVQLTVTADSAFVPVDGYYNGCILTYLDGNGRNRSVRIVGYDSTSTTGATATLMVEKPSGLNISSTAKWLPMTGDTFLINGRPFSGTGFGYSDIGSKNYQNGASLDLMTSINDITTAAGPNMRLPVALLPNFAAYAANGIVDDPFAGESRFVDHGGADEPWDAPDYQNMALSYYFNNGTPGSSDDVLPSFHRPDLIAYWYARLAREWKDPTGTDNDGFADLTAAQQEEMWLRPFNTDGTPKTDIVTTDEFPVEHRIALIKLKRRIMLRPLVEDNPNFTGSNPGYRDIKISGSTLLDQSLQWDVDNDRDGVMDSIWIDPGLPVVTGPHGRRYKKLAAILVRDQDAKLNLNAAGFFNSFETLTPDFADPTNGTYDYQQASITASANSANGSNAMARLIGAGYGPADFDLRNIFTNRTPPVTPLGLEYFKILNSRYADKNPAVSPPYLPGAKTTRDVGNERLALYGEIGLPTDWGGSLVGQAYGTYPLIAGAGMKYLDYTGRSRIATQSGTFSGSTINYTGANITNALNDPYEMNLNHPQGTDSPYTPGDLEALLRYNDYDGNYLSTRLKSDAPTTLANSQNRAALTTESYSMQTLPAPPVPLDLRGTAPTVDSPFDANQLTGGRAQLNSALWQNTMPTILDLARERVRRVLPGTLGGTTITEDQVQQIVRSTIPFEVLRGEPMDVNRLFNTPLITAGDAYNKDITLPNLDTYTPHYVNDYDIDYFDSGDGRNRPLKVFNGADTQFAPTFAKQLYARHLFCLALLLHDAGYDFPLFEAPTETAALSADDKRELTVRRIAQWAINVVDFRDNDAIMTPFEYDVNPWDGWGVDGDLKSDEADTTVFTMNSCADRRVVWGAEQPDLVISETLATHDKRLKDTDYDDGPQKDVASGDDPNLDQYRIPQGSLFFELYATRNLPANGTKLPGELYQGGQLNLSAVAPNNAPVWRMAVTKFKSAAEEKLLAQATGADGRPNTIMFQPNDPAIGVDPAKFNPQYPVDPTMPVASDPDIEIDRMIWFVGSSFALPTVAGDDLSRFDDMSFKYRDLGTGNPLLLTPNRYLVGGPRERTYFGVAPGDPGSVSDAALINAMTGTQYIDLGAGATVTTPGVTYPGVPNEIQTNTSALFTIPAPSGWVADPDEFPIPTSGVDAGLNISEPLPTAASYYKEPIDPMGSADRVGHYSTANPEDNGAPAPSTTLIPDTALDLEMGTPLQEYGSITTGTINDFKGLLLQRLADPTRNYHPAYNPYITVDWASVDLHVFNGEASTDPDDPDMALGNAVAFGSNERGRRNGSDSFSGDANGGLLGKLTNNGGLVDSAARAQAVTGAQGHTMNNPPTPLDTAMNFVNADGQEDYFRRPLMHSLGYLNRSLGLPLDNTAGTDGEYIGAPGAGANDMPFGFIYWPDSPFMSVHDLMLVPSSAPQRLTLEYSLFNNDNNIDQFGSADRTDLVERARDNWGRIGGLMNFYHSRDLKNLGALGDETRRAHMYRIFDYLTVPSRFVGTQKYYNGAAYEAGWTATDNLKNHLRFPFNKRSEFRDPGKVNLNTMGSEFIYNALFQENLFQNADINFPGWNEFQQSRGGSVAASSSTTRFNASARDFPSWFSDPFRTAAAGNMMPPLDPSNAGSNYNNALRVPGVDATELRSKKLLTNSSNTPQAIAGTDTEDQPLFEFRANSTATTRFTDTSLSAANRLQGIRRLDNLTTTQSNVYAVWITIGYFEVEPTTISQVHPDGWQLGQELGSDTGEIKRNRSFYLIDRSIPVGYEPGEDYNVEDAVLLKRRID